MGTSTASGSERQTAQGDPAKSFAEEALRLSGKSEEEARRTGAVDKADEQVELLFAPQYQTNSSPVHRAIWDGKVPLELFAPPPLPASAMIVSGYQTARRGTTVGRPASSWATSKRRI